MIRNVEVQAVESYPSINQKDNSHPKRKDKDYKRAGSVLSKFT
jgi:hypothetical protein